MIREQLPLLDIDRAPTWVTSVPASVSADTASRIVGDYMLAKYQQRAAQVGVQPVARQLRKQGVDVEIAVLMLAVRP